MNFKLRPDVVAEIRKHAAILARRRVHYALGACPLSFEDIKRAVMTDEQHELTFQLQKSGFNQFRSHNTVAMYVGTDEFAVRRSAVIHLALPEYCLVPRQAYLAFRNTKRISPEHHEQATASLHKLHLDEAQRVLVAAWVTRCVRETRLEDLINWVTKAALSHCQSTGHVLALWPFLATLVGIPDWRAKFRDAPRRLRDYAPSPSVMAEIGKEIGIAETLMHGAEMLEPWAEQPASVTPTLVAWEWLDNDRSYDLSDPVDPSG